MEETSFKLTTSISLLRQALTLVVASRAPFALKAHRFSLQFFRFSAIPVQEIINWLSPVNFRAIQSDTCLKHCPGTGEWLLQDVDFRNWKEGKLKAFWITGMRTSSVYL